MSTYYNATLFDTSGNALSPRPFYGPMDLDGDVAQATLTTAYLGDAAGFFSLMPIPLGKQILTVSLTWARAADTNGSPTLAQSIVLRTIDGTAAATVTDTVLATTANYSALGMAAAGTAPTGFILPLLPSTAGSGACGIGISNAKPYGYLGLKITATAATAQSALVTMHCTWK
jgi:hypothetical protein